MILKIPEYLEHQFTVVQLMFNFWSLCPLTPGMYPSALLLPKLNAERRREEVAASELCRVLACALLT